MFDFFDVTFNYQNDHKNYELQVVGAFSRFLVGVHLSSLLPDTILLNSLSVPPTTIATTALTPEEGTRDGGVGSTESEHLYVLVYKFYNGQTKPSIDFPAVITGSRRIHTWKSNRKVVKRTATEFKNRILFCCFE